MSRTLIITGDDFGLAVPVNEAIEEAHREGVLGATSLMIGERAAADAVERARRNPGLRVGLHLVVCEGRPLLPAHEIPALVDGHGELRGPVTAFASFLLFLLVGSARRQLEAEIRAQFQAFIATGLRLDHVNAHNNMQLHPLVLPILLRVAREHGVRAMRLPYEPLSASLRAAGGRGFWLRLLPWLGMAPWSAWVKRRITAAGFRVNDALFGIYDCGALDVQRLIGFVRNLPEGLSEIHCHLATRRCAEIDRTMPRYGHERELAALKSPDVRAALAASGAVRLGGFRDLEPA